MLFGSNYIFLVVLALFKQACSIMTLNHFCQCTHHLADLFDLSILARQLLLTKCHQMDQLQFCVEIAARL